jgi:hypothetical protein
MMKMIWRTKEEEVSRLRESKGVLYLLPSAAFAMSRKEKEYYTYDQGHLPDHIGEATILLRLMLAFSFSLDSLEVGLMTVDLVFGFSAAPKTTRRCMAVVAVVPVGDLTRDAVGGRAAGVGVAAIDGRFTGGGPIDPSTRFLTTDPVVEDAPLITLTRLLFPRADTFSPLVLPESDTTEVARDGGLVEAGVPSKREDDSRRWMTFAAEAEVGALVEPGFIAVLRLYFIGREQGEVRREKNTHQFQLLLLSIKSDI